MRLSLVASLLSIAGAASLAAQVPLMNRVVPDTGKTGSVLTVHGVFLGKTNVDEVYLSDHTFDMKVKVLAQTEDSIEFRIPPFAKPGRFQLVLKTSGKEPLVLEQPVYISVEEPNRTLQATATNPPPAGNATTK
jgi:hypothetical protein